MKLQIDTENKTIKVAENVKFNELIKVLNKLLPKEWKEYILESNSTIMWTTYPVYPWTYEEPWRIGDITYGTRTPPVENPYQVSYSVYNIDVQN